jgi:ribosomal protein S18 acetylase RimI-like enzyme
MGATANPELHYTVLRVPANSPHIADLVAKFRDTKLAALAADPGSFYQRYDVESLHPLSVWHSRLTHQRTCLVCVATSDSSLSLEDALIEGEWAGYAAVRGPISLEEYYASSDVGQPVPKDPENETRWHVYDLYTAPPHRGQGVAKKLGEGLVEVVTKDTQAMNGGAIRRARLRLVVHPDSTWLVKGYRDFGFNESGRVTLREGLVANGMEESVAEDTNSTEQLRAIWETRYGMVMEKVIDIV